MSFVRFLTACYLTFNMDMLTVAKALEALPALPLLTAAQGARSCPAQSLTAWCLSRAYAAVVSLHWSLFSVRPNSKTLVNGQTGSEPRQDLRQTGLSSSQCELQGGVYDHMLTCIIGTP